MDKILRVVSLFFLIWIVRLIYRKYTNPIAGPTGLPVIGNLLQIYLSPHKYLFETLGNWASIYGEVFMVSFGVQKTLCLHGYHTLKSALCQRDFSERHDAQWLLKRSFGKRIGLISGSKETWAPIKDFTCTHLYKSSIPVGEILQHNVVELISNLNNVIDQQQGITDTTSLFDIPSVSIIWAFATGNILSHTDPKLIKLTDSLLTYTQETEYLKGVGIAFPFLVKMFPGCFNAASTSNFESQKYLRNILKNECKPGKRASDVGNLVEAFLTKIKCAEWEETQSLYTEEMLLTVINDLLIAGADPLSSTLTFSIVWLSLYPEMQQTIRAELNTIDGEIEYGDIQKNKEMLPYTTAFILETFRCSHVIPLTPRKLYNFTTFGKHKIPAGTLVIGNLYSVMMDPKYWHDPQNFRPSRFLDDSGQVVKYERVINFSIGERACIGKTITELAIFAFVILLVQQFEFFPATKAQCLDTLPNMGGVLKPKPFFIKVRKIQPQ